MDETALVSLVCMLAFLILNPFLALFVVALVSFFRRVPVLVFICSASLAFTLFFFFRDYGIEWYVNSSDDVPIYRAIYDDELPLSFSDLIARFLEAPNGNEILWHIPWWGLQHVFGASGDTFVFVHYLALFMMLFAALSSLSKRYLVPFALTYLLLTPISLDALAHIWRQQLAFSVFLGGIGLHYSQRSRAGKWLIFASPLIHMSFLFFLALFLVAEFVRRHRGFDNKLRFTAAMVLLMAVTPLLSRVAISFLDSIGIARIMEYFEGYEADASHAYLIIAVYAMPMLVTYFLLRQDALNTFFVAMCFAVFSLVLALPGANSIYERLLMSVLTAWGLFFFRTVLMNFSVVWYLPFVTVVFISGVSRLQAAADQESGIGYFAAYGHAFDPLMGIVKMLVTL